MQGHLVKDKKREAGKPLQCSEGRSFQEKSRAKGARDQRVLRNPIHKLVGSAKKKLRSSTKSHPFSNVQTTKSRLSPSGQKKANISGGYRVLSRNED